MPSFDAEKYSQELHKHKQFIGKFNVFPNKTRKVIYALLMQLPINHSHFLELTKPFKELPGHTANRQASFIVNSLVKLYPSLSNQWLPGLIYPFVKLFQEDSIMCFQSSLTFLLNWYQPIFENYPNPSKRVMELAKKLLPNLNKKISLSDYTLSSILNPMILVCLTDVLNKQDSLQLLDFLVIHPYSPEYFFCAAIAIVFSVQEHLCKLQSVEQISIALRKQKKLNIQQVIQHTVQIAEQNRKQLDQIYSKCQFPLTRERYPVFQFVKKDIRSSNDALEKAKYDQMNNLSTKYEQLSSLIGKKLKQGMVANSRDIQNRYEDVEAQTTQYLNKMKRQHQMKLKALKQIQQKFKSQISYEEQLSKNSINSRNVKVIEKRGRLEKQILKLEQEASKIRELEQDMVNRLNKIAQIRKKQIHDVNKRLYQQQRSHNWDNSYQN